MRNALVFVVIGSTLWLTAPNTQALGFGRIANATRLGQPLNFAATVQLGTDESLGRDCVSAEVFSGDNRLPAGQVRVTLEPGGNTGERSVRITSSALIDEPVVTINVSVGCGAKISRRFVAFIDPPLIDTAQADAADAPRLVPQQVDSQVAPLLAIVQAAKAPAAAPVPPEAMASTAKPNRRAARGADSRQARSGRDQKHASAAHATRSRKLAASNPANPARATGAGVSRLQLEPAPVLAQLALAPPSAAASAIVVAQAAAAVPNPSASDAALVEALAVERRRILRLEEGSARMLSETQATRQTLAQLQARLQLAESERGANPLLYVLAVLVALLAASSAVLWRRQSKERAAPGWWAPPAEEAAAVPAESDAIEAVTEAEVAIAVPVAPPAPSAADTKWSASDSLLLPAGTAHELPSADPLTMPAGTADASVDELIDLEQQAEFFVVLGQDEAAIDLLMGHVRANSGVSPLPYLKLLEIYRRCDDREAYERIRARFNRRFNALAPDWESDLQRGRSLADYPDMLGRLQALWRTPEGVMELLEATLFRRVKTEGTLDLPAYRELLFLFSIARDLSEHGEVPGGGMVVDLLLPIEPLATAPPVAPVTASDMEATQNFAVGSTPSRSAPLDFDVSLPVGLVPKTGAFDTAPAAMDVADIGTATIDFNDVPSRPAALAYRR